MITRESYKAHAETRLNIKFVAPHVRHAEAINAGHAYLYCRMGDADPYGMLSLRDQATDRAIAHYDVFVANNWQECQEFVSAHFGEQKVYTC